jgi:hypothetical protein
MRQVNVRRTAKIFSVAMVLAFLFWGAVRQKERRMVQEAREVTDYQSMGYFSLKYDLAQIRPFGTVGERPITCFREKKFLGFSRTLYLSWEFDKDWKVQSFDTAVDWQFTGLR